MGESWVNKRWSRKRWSSLSWAPSMQSLPSSLHLFIKVNLFFFWCEWGETVRKRRKMRCKRILELIRGVGGERRNRWEREKEKRNERQMRGVKWGKGREIDTEKERVGRWICSVSSLVFNITLPLFLSPTFAVVLTRTSSPPSIYPPLHLSLISPLSSHFLLPLHPSAPLSFPPCFPQSTDFLCFTPPLSEGTGQMDAGVCVCVCVCVRQEEGSAAEAEEHD